MVFHFFPSISPQNALGYRSTKHTTVSQKRRKEGIVERSRLFESLVYILSQVIYARSSRSRLFIAYPNPSARPIHRERIETVISRPLDSKTTDPISLSHPEISVTSQSTSTTPSSTCVQLSYPLPFRLQIAAQYTITSSIR